MMLADPGEHLRTTAYRVTLRYSALLPRRTLSMLRAIIAFLFLSVCLQAAELRVNDKGYLETQGLSVLVYQNAFHPVFKDQKLSAIEIILHDDRIATDGDLRLMPTPEQWDPVPHFKERKRTGNGLTAFCDYPDYKLSYRLEVQPEGNGFRVAVHLDQPLPAALVGKAGFNLDFDPSAYFGKSYMFDNTSGIIPRSPDARMQRESNGTIEPTPLASGNQVVLSPEDPLTRVTVTSDSGAIMLFDARNQAQNGWLVLRTLLPANRTENALVWHVRPNVIAGWTRPPVVSYNQVGYTPERSKVAVIELDPLYDAPKTARVLKLAPDGEYKEVFSGEVKWWGKWLRYNYAHFDFSVVREPGIYSIEYAGKRNPPFRIATDVYADIWHPSLDTWLAQEMDHVRVREDYRIWHGLCHEDDARQAPVSYTHFDGYAMGPSTDSPYKPGEHIPGLNVGGWHDAGDFDIRTQSQDAVIIDLVLTRELFGADWDNTAIDEKARYVQIHKSDGVPDIVQQVEHGVLQLLAQYKAVGHALNGIIEPTLEEYTHLGDAASQTDGRIYSDKMAPLESDGIHSGVPDDRWAFTTRSTPLEYDAAAALAAASRVLRGYNDQLADECLKTAIRVWDDEHSHVPNLFHSFNTTGGDLQDEEVRAAVELLITTKGGEPYQRRLTELWPAIQKNFFLNWAAVRAIPFMDAAYKAKVEQEVRTYKARVDEFLSKNPYGVPVTPGAWGGAGAVVGFATQMYFLHQAFPDIVGTEYTLRGIDYVLGTHPASNVSYVSTVGTNSRLVAYGNNRADYTFIPGGIIPGIVIVQPDFPELKPNLPFLWFENEYVVDTVTSYILAANAANAVAK
jgi:endoglucanase